MKLINSKKPFTFTVSPDEFTKAMTTLGSVSKEDLIFGVNKGKAYMYAFDKGIAAAIAVPLKESEGTGALLLSSTILKTVTSGRKADLIFEVEGTNFKFKAKTGSFKGDLKSQALAEDVVDSINELLTTQIDGAIELSATEQETIWGAVEQASISDAIHGTMLNRMLHKSEKGLKVSSFDSIHMAQVITKVSGAPFKIALTDDYINLFRKIHQGANAVKMVMSETAFYSSSEVAALYMPPMQCRDEDWSTVGSFLKNFPSNPKVSFNFKPQRLTTALTALCAVFEAGAYIKCVPGKSGLNLSIKSTYGEMSETMPCEEITGSESFNIEPYCLLELLGLLPAGDVVTMSVVPKQQYILTCESSGAKYLGSMYEE